MGIAADVYAQELGNYNHGLPLWSPEPADGFEVRVGDVGHVDEDGQFHRLFNVTVDANHPYNVDLDSGEPHVPTDFYPLQFNSRLFSVKPKQILAGPLPSKSVKSHEIGGSASANPTGFVGGGFSYNFDCSKEQGAFLLLLDDAKKTVVLPAVNFATYMRKCHSSWYEFATNPQYYGLSCKPEDIILVRGTVKTSAWALGAYTENGSHVHDVEFNAQAGGIASAGFKWSTSNQTSSRFEHRIGPSDSQSLRRLNSARSSIASGKAVARPSSLELPEVLAERKLGIEAAVDADNTDNQCVFLSYYKIKYRLFTFKKIMAAAGPAELPDRDDDNEGSSSVLMDTDSVIETVPSPTKYRTPVDDVLDYILEHCPAAQVAIASDGDVDELLQGSEVPDDFPKFLTDIMPKIDVDEDGTGTLSVEDAIRRTHRNNAVTAEQLAAEQIHLQLELQYEQAQIEAAHAAEYDIQMEIAQSDSVQDARPTDEASTDAPPQSPSAAPTDAPTDAPATTPGDGPSTDVPDDALVDTPDDAPIIPGSSFLSSAEPRITGSNMSREGFLLLPKRGPNANAIPWLHVMLMDKDAEGGSVTDMAVCEKENGRYAATGCEDCAVRIWDMETGVMYAKLEHHEDTVWAVAFSPDGTKVVSGGADQKGVLWDVEERSIIKELTGHEGDVWTLAYSPNGKFIATGSVDRTVRLWDGRNGSLITKLPDHSAVVMSVKFSPDSTRLVTCGDCTGHICDVPSGTLLAKLEGHTGIIWDLDFAPDSSRVVTAAEDYTARIWSLEDGQELCTLREHGGPVWSVAFSPDDKEVASGSYDCLLTMCDSYTGEQHHMLGQDNPAIINTVTYSKDGDFVAAGGADGNVRFWDARSGDLMGQFQGHDDKVKKVVFTPDGNRLVSSSDDGTIRAWSVRDVLRL